MSRRGTLSSFSGAAQILVNAGLLLLVVRGIIGALGMQAYGVYALISAVGALGVFAGFGFNTSLIKFLSEQRDRRQSNYDILAAFLFIGAASAVVAAVAVLFSDFVLLRLLHIPPEMVTPQVRVFYFACVGANLVQLLSQIPAAVLDAQQKVYLTNGIQLGMGALGKGAMIISLVIAPDLGILGWVMLGASCLTLGALLSGARVTWGPLSAPGWRRKVFPLMRKQFAYGKTVYASSVVGLVYESVTKVFISHWAGLTEVGYLDIALRVKNPLWMVLDRLAYPVLPKIAATRSLEEIRGFVEEAERKLAVIVVPVTIATLFLSAPGVAVWLGSVPGPVLVSIVCIVSTFMIAVLFVPLFDFLLVKGYPHKMLEVQLLNLLVTIGGIVALVPWFGYYGALAGYCLASLVSTAFCIWYQRKLLGRFPFADPPFRARLLKLGAGMAIVNAATPLAGGTPWVRLALIGSVNAVVAVVLFRRLRVVTAEDVERYVGRESRAGMLLEKLLLGGGRP